MSNSNTCARFPLASEVVVLKFKNSRQIAACLDKCKMPKTDKKDVKVPAATMAGLDAGTFTVRLSDLSKRLEAACDLSNVDEWMFFREFRRYLDLVETSFRKDTKTHNTSVTAGVSASLLQKEGDMCWILNCGTGDVKYQLYVLKNGEPNVVMELKGTREGFSVSGLAVETAGYNPLNQQGDEKPPSITKEALVQGFCDDLTNKIPDKYKNVPFFAVVTGTIRQHWANLVSEESKKEAGDVENELRNVFAQVNEATGTNVQSWNGGTYLISQEEEGVCEMVACTNLVSSVKANGKVVAMQGIGKGTGQFVLLLTHEDGTTEHRVFGYPYGMNAYTNLSGLGSFIDSVFTDRDVMAAFFRTLRNTVQGGFTPVVALKSGCLLAVAANAELRKILDPYAEEATEKKSRPTVEPSSTDNVLLHTGAA